MEDLGSAIACILLIIAVVLLVACVGQTVNDITCLYQFPGKILIGETTIVFGSFDVNQTGAVKVCRAQYTSANGTTMTSRRVNYMWLPITEKDFLEKTGITPQYR